MPLSPESSDRSGQAWEDLCNPGLSVQIDSLNVLYPQLSLILRHMGRFLKQSSVLWGPNIKCDPFSIASDQAEREAKPSVEYPIALKSGFYSLLIIEVDSLTQKILSLQASDTQLLRIFCSTF